MVHLTRIYTRTGDGGQTRLSDMSLADKTDPRVAAYGDVDEANSARWLINDKCVEWIWWREGLEVPVRRPERRPVSDNDGSCLRRRPECRHRV